MVSYRQILNIPKSINIQETNKDPGQ